MGWSRKMTLALEFQEKELFVVLAPLFAMLHGPSSKRRPVEELQPGPPLSQRTRGSLEGFDRDSKYLRRRRVSYMCEYSEMERRETYQKKRLLSSSMSKYPETCFTLLSHRSGSVIRSWYSGLTSSSSTSS